jgi:prolycopene isomerase
MGNNFDYIVVGAGCGGATIASLLANDGKRVLLVDKNSSAGGKMSTFHKDGHTYELFPLNLVPFAPSLFEKLSERVGKPIRNVAYGTGDHVNILYSDRNNQLHLFDSSKKMSMFKAFGIK